MTKATYRPAKTTILTTVLLLAAYAPVWWWMWDRWFARDSYYSHGILIPFVSAYLIWQRRGELRTLSGRTHPAGIGLVVLGLLIYAFSALFRVYFSSGISFLLVLCGWILHRYGMDVFRRIWFPVVFLVFMIPAPLVVIVSLSFRMKLFAAGLATSLLNGMGLEAVRKGSILYLAHTQVVVDDVCSGLRSLISLTALGALFTYWLEGPFWKRVVLFFSTIPIAVITNVCRIVFLSTVSEVWGARYAGGIVHDASGMMIFVLAFVLLYFVSRILEGPQTGRGE